MLQIAEWLLTNGHAAKPDIMTGAGARRMNWQQRGKKIGQRID
jgi:hypothetical protein